MFKFELGSKVKCKYTGFMGTIMARTEFINGCIQYDIVPKSTKERIPDAMGIDEKSLILISKPKKEIKKKTVKKRGGPMSKGKSMRGY